MKFASGRSERAEALSYDVQFNSIRRLRGTKTLRVRAGVPSSRKGKYYLTVELEQTHTGRVKLRHGNCPCEDDEQMCKHVIAAAKAANATLAVGKWIASLEA